MKRKLSNTQLRNNIEYPESKCPRIDKSIHNNKRPSENDINHLHPKKWYKE